MPAGSAARARLTRERVVHAGVALADAEGLAALSMRRLGAALDVQGMALYKHVANKDDLLEAMFDVVLGEVDPPVPGGNWKAELRRFALAMFAALLRHPWACQLRLSGGGASGPVGAHHSDAILGTLRQGGFSVALTHRAYHVLDIYVYGFAAGTVSFPVAREDLGAMAEAFLHALPRDALPYLAEHITYHIEADVLSEGDFEFGVDLLLDSLERRRGP